MSRNPRRVPRFSIIEKPVFFLPPRCPVVPAVQTVKKPGFHTHYLSCDIRGLSLYEPHAFKSFQRGFRAAFVAAEGLVFDANAVVVLGLQDGDCFEHAKLWASSNPLDEINAEMTARRVPITIKAQQQVQSRFADAIAAIEGVEEARLEAEAELQVATAEIIGLQGVESICLEGVYYDLTYSREKVWLKRRNAKFNPEESEVEIPKKRGKKAAKRRSGRAA